MVLDVIEKGKELDGSSSYVRRIVTQQVEEIIESSNQGTKEDRSRQQQWSYRMPYPGVRYYSYQER